MCKMLMKTIKQISILIALAFLTFSCNDWLDVKPKTQVESSELFKTESGYKDALWGIYTQMTETSMYGLNMTVSLDALAKIYSRIGTSSVMYALSNYDYTETQAQGVIDAVWQKTYSTIANLNNLIANLEQEDTGKFSENNYQVIYGEALGLRAFLHFDLLRLFAPSYAADPNADSIPYVTTFDYNITETSTVSQTIEQILEDLEAALSLLKESDPIVTGREISTSDDNGYLLNRNLRFNYYAAVATMARVYHYKGDKSNATLKAQEVIDNSGCTWTSVDRIAVTEADRDRTFTSEQIFALKIESMETNIQYALSLDSRWCSYNSVSVMADDAALIYPYSTDWRGWTTLYGWSEDIAVSSWYVYRMPTKLWQYEDMDATYECLMPLIRLPEMKLIIAECNPTTQGVEIINEIREHRGIAEKFPESATEGEVLTEIRNEYQREFYCEGVMWFYYKRLNSGNIPYYSYGRQYGQTMDQDKYVWPMPDEEIEFGNRN